MEIKSGWRLKLTNLLLSVKRLSRECGNLDVSQPYGPPQPVTAVVLLLHAAYFLTILIGLNSFLLFIIVQYYMCNTEQIGRRLCQVPRSNLVQQTGYSALPQPLQSTDEIVPEIETGPLLSTEFPIHEPLIIFSVDAI
jgi:hypothetical protein